ncbi:MAG: UDP-N-acetylmuramoyl-tripeptide--D-alanyl-D-alanine ligase [Kiritimatiellae bacterium]|nr:UDP-N-acetylmuramoyl-tripeptide--D-alanyl-D-alanine ligase [Kiritimatiellia bacterium]
MISIEELCRWTDGNANAAAVAKSFDGVVFDSRNVRKGCLYVALKGANTDGHRFVQQAIEAGAAAALVRMDWPPCGMACAVNELPLVRVADPKTALTAAAREYRKTLAAKVVGVTGSAGKTTTKELLARMLAQVGKTAATPENQNNDLGMPVAILNTPRDAAFCVLEMGTNHPGEIAHLVSVAHPDAGVITNIGNAHAEFFKTLDGTAAEKGTLVANLPADGFAVLDRDGVKFATLAAMASARVVAAGLEDAECAKLAHALEENLPGRHNVLNARLAEACAMALGATEEQCVAALEGFSPPGHRWRPVEWHGAIAIDDTYNANPESMIAALDTFGGNIAVLGTMGELGEAAGREHARVLAHALALGLDAVILVGGGWGVPGGEGVRVVPDAAAAKAELLKIIHPGAKILLKGSRTMQLEEIIARE